MLSKEKDESGSLEEMKNMFMQLWIYQQFMMLSTRPRKLGARSQYNQIWCLEFSIKTNNLSQMTFMTIWICNSFFVKHFFLNWFTILKLMRIFQPIPIFSNLFWPKLPLPQRHFRKHHIAKKKQEILTIEELN